MKGLQRDKVWDPVSRLWHWVLAVAVVANWIFGSYMTFDTVQWHFYVGYAILALLVFRLIWGFIGPGPVRFKSFLPTPSKVTGYLGHVFKREPSGFAGHTPLGALSVYAILLVVAGQAISGLFIETDDFFDEGPLNDYVSDDVVDLMNSWHHTLPDVILILVILHVAAIAFYWAWKRENLVKPMITGWKWVRRH
ncbi:MAG TPA: cytochrome b/b6 domain-containing protein [Gammaproteobacteria bacterium]|nr:cytochrome b/b6 domain-containing protein [Gammaproteobacteria bacterium]